jgi:hypothetical protein
MQAGHDRHQDHPGDGQAGEHGDADGDAHQVARAHQGQRAGSADAGGAGAGLEVARDFGGEDLGGGQRRERGRGQGAQGDGDQARLALGLTGPRAGADLQHLGGGDAFGIGQVGIGHQGPAQGDGVHHAQDTADRAGAEGGQERNVRPPADHQQARQHEDHRRQRPRRRGDGLDDVVFLDGRRLEGPQQAIEMTAAGIEVAKVRPTFRPR